MEQPATTNRTSRPHGFLPWCRRYISFPLVGMVGILVFILFFTDNSIPDTYIYDREIDELRTEIKNANDTLDYYMYLNSRLFSDTEAMEAVVRENYHMQRQGEEVYVD